MSIITLITDFGSSDWFTGTMKGVILGIAPNASIVDVTHGIPSGDIRAGAFALAAACRFFPKGAIHVAVVDPVVGSERPAIAIQTENAVFVGPDNGVLSWALARESITGIRRLENRAYFLPEISRTFHGRDIFAPVAAHLSNGITLEFLGPEQKNCVRIPFPKPRQTAEGITGEVLYIDRFGNAITNIAAEMLDALGRDRLTVSLGGANDIPIGRYYAEVQRGKAIALVSSGGFLEIAVNGGSAAAAMNLEIGSEVRVTASC